jgi:hypothetical protein
MKLSTQEADLFFELMWKLQFFVNQRLNIEPSIKTVAEYIACPTQDKMKVREALYQNKHLIDSFVQENPENISPDKLLMVSKWKDAVEGEFYIERLLKKHAILISEKKQVYGVCGIHQDFDEMINPYDLPLLVHAVLLPFSGKVVYDGLFRAYKIHFGGGIRGDLKESYMIAKQNNRVIDSFESQPSSKHLKAHVLKDWRPEIDELYEKAKHLKAGSNCPLTYGAAFGLVKASLEFAQAVMVESEDLDILYKSLRKIQRELGKAYTVISREER